MYSPNGTGWRFAYRWPGPVAGSQTMPVVCRSFGPGPSVTAPTRIGTLTACTAVSMSGRVSASLYGSMSVEFSGQITRSGFTCVPASTCFCRSSVAFMWFLVTVRARPRNSSPLPGTLPCTIAAVTVLPLPSVDSVISAAEADDREPGDEATARRLSALRRRSTA